MAGEQQLCGLSLIRLCACGCGKPVPTDSPWAKQQRYFSFEHKVRANNRRQNERERVWLDGVRKIRRQLREIRQIQPYPPSPANGADNEELRKKNRLVAEAQIGLIREYLRQRGVILILQAKASGNGDGKGGSDGA